MKHYLCTKYKPLNIQGLIFLPYQSAFTGISCCVCYKALKTAFRKGELSRITEILEADCLLTLLTQKEWVVYSKACLQRAETILDYLARYTHRIAISNSRIVDMTEDTVSFRYTDQEKCIFWRHCLPLD